jgi:uncharacterized protein YgiM (DUF1202 family)
MRFVRAAASAAVAALLSAGAATAKPIATTAETNLRKAAGTDSEVVTLIPKGATVKVGKCSSGWCEASFDGKEGFVIARNVGLAPPPMTRASRLGAQVVEEEVVEGPPGPAVYYRPYYYRRYYPYGYYYRPWGWGWR